MRMYYPGIYFHVLARLWLICLSSPHTKPSSSHRLWLDRLEAFSFFPKQYVVNSLPLLLHYASETFISFGHWATLVSIKIRFALAQSKRMFSDYCKRTILSGTMYWLLLGGPRSDITALAIEFYDRFVFLLSDECHAGVVLTSIIVGRSTPTGCCNHTRCTQHLASHQTSFTIPYKPFHHLSHFTLLYF